MVALSDLLGFHGNHQNPGGNLFVNSCSQLSNPLKPLGLSRSFKQFSTATFTSQSWCSLQDQKLVTGDKVQTYPKVSHKMWNFNGFVCVCVCVCVCVFWLFWFAEVVPNCRSSSVSNMEFQQTSRKMGEEFPSNASFLQTCSKRVGDTYLLLKKIKRLKNTKNIAEVHSMTGLKK